MPEGPFRWSRDAVFRSAAGARASAVVCLMRRPVTSNDAFMSTGPTVDPCSIESTVARTPKVQSQVLSKTLRKSSSAKASYRRTRNGKVVVGQFWAATGRERKMQVRRWGTASHIGFMARTMYKRTDSGSGRRAASETVASRKCGRKRRQAQSEA
jgi:hypothetical protein